MRAMIIVCAEYSYSQRPCSRVMEDPVRIERATVALRKISEAGRIAFRLAPYFSHTILERQRSSDVFVEVQRAQRA
jgi:hypothetical protein